MKRAEREQNGRDARGGFTLTEAVVSVLVFTVGIIGIYGLTTSLLRMNRLVENARTSTTMAEAKIEELLASPYTSLTSGKRLDGDYALAWTVAAGPVAGCRELTVTVTWRNAIGRTQDTTLRTVVSP